MIFKTCVIPMVILDILPLDVLWLPKAYLEVKTWQINSLKPRKKGTNTGQRNRSHYLLPASTRRNLIYPFTHKTIPKLVWVPKSNHLFLARKGKRKKKHWCQDSACSRIMTGDKKKFLSLSKVNVGVFYFGDVKKGIITRVGKIRNLNQEH